MLTFLIPLKSKKTAKSWIETSQLVEKTLQSICSQTSDRYQVILVGNDPPDLHTHFPKLTFLRVDFPSPQQVFQGDQNSLQTFRSAADYDRDAKVTYGLLYIYRHQKTSYVMVVDADDWISCHLAEFVEQNAQVSAPGMGWFLTSGYRHQVNSSWVRLMRKGFDRYCGTSMIVRLEGYDFLSQSLDIKLINRVLQEATLNSILKKLTDLYIKKYRHRDIRETFEKRGHPLSPLPFPGAVYVQHGDNILLGQPPSSSKKLTWKIYFWRFKALMDHRYFAKNLRREFGIDR